MQTRRTFLTAASAGFAAAIPASARSQSCVVPFDQARYQKYIDLYCAFDPAFMQFYAEDVVMTLGPNRLKGRQAVYDYFTPLRYNIKETIDVTFFVADASRMAVQVNGGFICTGDINDTKLWGRPLKKGEARRIQGVLLYTVDKSGKIKTIGGPPPEVIHDWQIEKS